MSSQPKTKEEVRDEFLYTIQNMINIWNNADTEKTKEKLEGLAFSIMNIFDGTSSLPAFDIVVRPHPDDKDFQIEQGENYYEDGMIINDDVMLHEMIFKNR